VIINKGAMKWKYRPGPSCCHDVAAEGHIIGKLIREEKVEVFQ